MEIGGSIRKFDGVSRCKMFLLEAFGVFLGDEVFKS